MRISQIRVDGLRNLREVAFQPGRGFNLLVGDNGAGKTSLLGALHLLAHGRSFLAGTTDGLIRRGEDRFTLFVEVVDGKGRDFSLAMQRGAEGWILRNNGQPVSTLVEFVRHLAVITQEPESHQLLTGPGEGRRRFLDWLLFHVEPDFLGYWRRYLRALRQRNAALRTPGQPMAAIEAWERELAVSGEQVDACRRAVLLEIETHLAPTGPWLSSAWAEIRTRYRSGWPSGMDLATALAEGRTSDRERGFTQRGPHRSDWRLEFPESGHHHRLSRGQTKLLATACLLAQAALYNTRKQDTPIFVCDDLGAELDNTHQLRLLDALAVTGAQVFVTGTQIPAAWAHRFTTETGRFHVEQGRIGPLL